MKLFRVSQTIQYLYHLHGVIILDITESIQTSKIGCVKMMCILMLHAVMQEHSIRRSLIKEYCRLQ
jgi:hypothetical protein